MSGLRHYVPRAIAWCGLVIQDETTEVHAVLQSFTKCISICCVPGTGLCGSVLTPGVLWLSCRRIRSSQNCVQDCVGDSARGIRTQNVKRVLDLGVGRAGARPCDTSGWQCGMLGGGRTSHPAQPSFLSALPSFIIQSANTFLRPVLSPGLQWKYSDKEDTGPAVLITNKQGANFIRAD